MNQNQDQDICNNDKSHIDLTKLNEIVETSFKYDILYKQVKTKLSNIIDSYSFANNTNCLKYITSLIIFICIILQYITSFVLLIHYFINCSFATIKILKNNESDVNNLLSNWIFFFGVIFVFYMFDLISNFIGYASKIIFELVKLFILIKLYHSEELKTKCNDFIIKIYSCNNRIIDGILLNINKIINYGYTSVDDTLKDIRTLTSEKLLT